MNYFPAIFHDKAGITNGINFCNFASPMEVLKKIYKDSVYGIMGTLIFHILLVSFFLISEINLKVKMKEAEIIIDFPEIQITEEKIEISGNYPGDQLTNDPSNGLAQNNIAATNRLSGRLSSSDKFFDENYNREVASAKNLVKEVDKQLSREVIDIDEIKMPVETTDGIDPEDIINKTYSGESNIVYYLANRYHLKLPIPVYLAQGGGKVIVDVFVDRNGKVIEAIPRQSSGISDKTIFDYARIAALRTIFNADPSAPLKQSGTIHYTFIPQ